MQEIENEAEAFGPQPEWEREEECQTGRVAEQVQFVGLCEFVRWDAILLGSRGVIEDLLRDNVLHNEENCAGKCGEEADKVGVKVSRACQDDAKCEWYQGEVCRQRISNPKVSAVRNHRQKRRETLDCMHERHWYSRSRIGA